MQRRDYIAIKKIMKEMSIGISLLGNTAENDFLENEMLKRALGMTCINVGELVKVIGDETRKKLRNIIKLIPLEEENPIETSLTDPVIRLEEGIELDAGYDFEDYRLKVNNYINKNRNALVRSYLCKRSWIMWNKTATWKTWRFCCGRPLTNRDPL